MGSKLLKKKNDQIDQIQGRKVEQKLAKIAKNGGKKGTKNLRQDLRLFDENSLNNNNVDLFKDKDPESRFLRTLDDGFINNNDDAGNSIVSKITNTLGSLKTLSALNRRGGVGSQSDGGENRNFNLFTHHRATKDGKEMPKTYEALKEAILELYLSVKIRSDDEIDNYNEDLFRDEKR